MFNFKKKKISGFWGKLPKPFFVLAPMANVTDVAFRQILAKYGKPDVMWSEFVSADGLVRAPKALKSEARNGKEIRNPKHEIRNKFETQNLKHKFSPQEIMWRDLMYFENERPIVAQLFSSKPKMMEEATYQITKAGFDGIDINMGCPDRTIQKQESGAKLIKNPKKAIQLIKSAKKGIKKACAEMQKEIIPLSVKTRLGYNKDNMEEWLTTLLKQNLAVITLHSRTKKEMSKVPAHWKRVADAVKLRDKLKSKTLIIGNGDVKDLEDAKQKAKKTGCDGVMIGRAVFGNPWFFNKVFEGGKKINLKNKLDVLLEHTKLFEKYLSHKNFNLMEKHFKAYVSGFKGAKELRGELMKTKNSFEVARIIKFWIVKNLT